MDSNNEILILLTANLNIEDTTSPINGLITMIKLHFHAEIDSRAPSKTTAKSISTTNIQCACTFYLLK